MDDGDQQLKKGTQYNKLIATSKKEKRRVGELRELIKDGKEVKRKHIGNSKTILF